MNILFTYIGKKVFTITLIKLENILSKFILCNLTFLQKQDAVFIIHKQRIKITIITIL